MLGSDDEFDDFELDNERFFVFNDRNIIISDFFWWLDNEPELFKWLEENTKNGVDCLQGMTLTFNNNKELSWFALRWQ